ncbi:MAG: hypothetical protein JSV65_07485 [Armatimonadota bacterium]|nr:MAG: hypothetical protein JSV65_07485 [Armatimonadota bacterium]
MTPISRTDAAADVQQATADGGARRNASSAVTWRAIVVGLVLVPLNTWWLAEIEWVRYSDNATTSALFFHAVALLLLLLAFNSVVARVAPRWVFSRVELLVIYIMVTSASVLGGHDQLQILVSTLAAVIGRATPENQWATLVHPYLPRHLVVMDPAVIKPLFQGKSSLYASGHWRAWLAPLGWWSLFAMTLVWVMFCMASLLRRQWDAERLNYPIAEVPLQVTSESFFRQRLLWVGFALAAIPQLVNLVHVLAPEVPQIPVGGRYFAPSYPWNSHYLLTIPVYLFPFVYGLAFLLPQQLMFSWLFFLLITRLGIMTGIYFGVRDWQRFPYVMEQGTGSTLGVVLVILWAARGHLRAVWRSVWGRAQLDDAEEAVSYRTAIIGLLVGAAALLGFAISAGMRPHTAFFYLAAFFVIVLVTARLRAELGLPTFELFLAGPDQVLRRVGGVQAWSRYELTTMGLFMWLSRTHRQFPILTQVDALRMGRRSRMSLRGLTPAILLASGVGIIAAFWAMLHVTYQVGFDSARFNGPAMWAFGREPMAQLMQDIQAPGKRDFGSIGAYLFGAIFTVFLGAMRTRFLWWPLHPIGYLAAASYGAYRMWLPVFVTWVIKGFLLRYGGLRAYRRALPFFLGLILGEFSAGFLRTVIDLAFDLYLPTSSGIGGL